MILDDTLKHFEPDSESLLRKLSARTSNEALEQIAMADNGADVDVHLAALIHLRDTGTFREPLHWVPAEVLELIRWSGPEDPEWKPGHTGELGHWMRAFSCAALLRATSAPWNYGDGVGTDSTVVQLILSLDALPIDFTLEAARFLAWLLLHKDTEMADEQNCAYGVGLLWFGLMHPSHFEEAKLVTLVDWIFQQTDLVFRTSAGTDGALRRLAASSQTWVSWEKVGVKLLELDLSGRSLELQISAQAVGAGLLNEWQRNEWKASQCPVH